MYNIEEVKEDKSRENRKRRWRVGGARRRKVVEQQL